MANQKISELTELVAAATDDEFVVVDVSEGSTKKITASGLLASLLTVDSVTLEEVESGGITLSAISQKLHHGNVVASCFMDTREWRDRMSHTSWENETLCAGVWRGWLANEAAARAISGAATGDYYGSTADGKFYQLDATSGVTEVFRGNARKIPATVSVQAEAGLVVLYDVTTAGCPMWMVIARSASWGVNWGVLGYNIDVRSIAFSQSKLLIGTNLWGMLEVDFARDSIANYYQTDLLFRSNTISRRNSELVGGGSSSGKGIVAIQVNSIAATVLPGAPIDENGLAVPTIAVATAGGVTVIKHDGMPVNSANTSNFRGVAFNGRFDLIAHQGVDAYGLYICRSGVYLSSSFALTQAYAHNTTPNSGFAAGTTPTAAIPAGKGLVRGSSAGATIISESPATLASSMVAAITAAYPGMWQVGTGRAWLCGSDTADRGALNKPLTAVGTLTETTVGAVTMYSGWSADNYREEAYSSDLDFGTGDCLLYMGWSVNSNNQVLHRAQVGSEGGVLIHVDTSIYVYLSASTTYTQVLYCASCVPQGSPAFVAVYRFGGVLYAAVNGVIVSSVADSTSLTYSGAVTRVGARVVGSAANTGSLGLVRIGGTPPSADQIAQIYRDELKLFQTGASGTLAGSSSAVVGADHDPATDLSAIATPTHVSMFKGPLRTSSTAAPASVGTIAGVATKYKYRTIYGSAGSYIERDAISIRESIEGEFKRVVEQPVIKDFDAVTSQVAFVLDKGYTALTVRSAGAIKREGSTKDWTRSTDGYQETVTFATAPGNAVWVQVEMIRSAA